jgi:hypothetical protein
MAAAMRLPLLLCGHCCCVALRILSFKPNCATFSSSFRLRSSPHLGRRCFLGSDLVLPGSRGLSWAAVAKVKAQERRGDLVLGIETSCDDTGAAVVLESFSFSILRLCACMHVRCLFRGTQLFFTDPRAANFRLGF